MSEPWNSGVRAACLALYAVGASVAHGIRMRSHAEAIRTVEKVERERDDALLRVRELELEIASILAERDGAVSISTQLERRLTEIEDQAAELRAALSNGEDE